MLRFSFAGLSRSVPLTVSLLACSSATATSPPPDAIDQPSGVVVVIELSPPMEFITNGAPVTLTATPRDAHGYPRSVPVSWSSSDPSTATVDTGVVTGMKRGQVTISARAGVVEAKITLTVMAAGIAVRPGSDNSVTTLAPGETFQFSAVELGAKYEIVDLHPSVTWAVDDPKVASVSPSGLVTALAEGSAAVTASLDEVSGHMSIDVVRSHGTAHVRLMHVADGIGPVTFSPNSMAPATLAFGESRGLEVRAGHFDVALAGIPTSPDTYGLPYQDFNGALPTDSYSTFLLTGSRSRGFLLQLWDKHPAVPADRAFVRVVMAGDYAANYYGNNIYYLEPGAPISPDRVVACYFDNPAYTGYGDLPAVAFDLVIEDAGFYQSSNNTTVPGVEAARFALTPAPGRATTYVIVGSTRETLRVITLLDP